MAIACISASKWFRPFAILTAIAFLGSASASGLGAVGTSAKNDFLELFGHDLLPKYWSK